MKFVINEREKNSFQVIGFDPITTAEEAKAAGIEKMELEQIWPLADYITVHTPLIPATRDLISHKSLSQCKRGVKVVNVARGGIISESDLLDALKSGQCGGAALDVYSEEPPKSELTKALIQHPAVIATPHLGASTGKYCREFSAQKEKKIYSISFLLFQLKLKSVLLLK